MTLRPSFVWLVAVGTLSCGGLAPDDGLDGAVGLDASDAHPPFFEGGLLGDASSSTDGATGVDAGPVSTCGPSNCIGCCRQDGTCDTDPSATSCGIYGSKCEVCPTGAVCNKPLLGCSFPVKQCDSTCKGCCVPPGTWDPKVGYCGVGIYDTSCGTSGQTCAICPAGNTCSAVSGGGGTCTPSKTPCTPQNCNGCCFGDVCAVGNQTMACGTGGQHCASCLIGHQKCVAGACGN